MEEKIKGEDFMKVFRTEVGREKRRKESENKVYFINRGAKIQKREYRGNKVFKSRKKFC